MPWQRGGARPVLPTNAVTGQAYRGVNILSLWVSALERGYDSGEWATLRQWNEKGARVRKGEKASPIVFYKEITVEAEPRRTTTRARPERRRFARGYWVFAAEQVEGYAARHGAAAQPDRAHRSRRGLLRRDRRHGRRRRHAGLLSAFDRHHPHAGRGALLRYRWAHAHRGLVRRARPRD